METDASHTELVQAILVQAAPMPLDAGVPCAKAHALLHQMNRVTLGNFDEFATQALASALWLRHNYLDESHALSQQIDNPTGSFLHGIMHRREGDFGNAKYWFRRVGSHPAIELIAKAASERLKASYEPFQMVDLVSRWRNTGGPEEANLIELQQIEWNGLFNWMHQSFRARD